MRTYQDITLFQKVNPNFAWTIHSTVTALLGATDSLAVYIDRGNVNAVVFLDLKTAFDTVYHTTLLSKLSAYGIQENAYKKLRYVFLVVLFPKPALFNVVSLKGLCWVLYCFCYT